MSTEPGLVVYRFGAGLFYANAARLTEEALALVDVPQPPRWFILLADAVDDIDFTGGKTLLELAGQLSERGVVLAIAAVTKAVRPELDRFGRHRRNRREPHLPATHERDHRIPERLTDSRSDQTNPVPAGGDWRIESAQPVACRAAAVVPRAA